MQTRPLLQIANDPQRLRILNLLNARPCAVGELMSVLGETQVKVSKQLAILRAHGLVKAQRRAQWQIYSLSSPASPLLTAMLNALANMPDAAYPLKGDLRQLAQLKPKQISPKQPRTRKKAARAREPEPDPEPEPHYEEELPVSLL
ncbi:MAG: ArsR/SmtB family transcription factor [Verrucomicrobiota bacterium]